MNKKLVFVIGMVVVGFVLRNLVIETVPSFVEENVPHASMVKDPGGHGEYFGNAKRVPFEAVR